MTKGKKKETSELNRIFKSLGFSKVKLAKYLGVSRQMVYNYLELDSLDEWPKEKEILIFKLLGISDGSNETLSKIEVTPEFILEVESKINQSIKDTNEINNITELKGLSKEEQQLYKDLTYLIRDKITEEYKHEENIASLTYIYHILQSIDNVPEVKYFLAYISKSTGFTNPNEFKYNEDKQFSFEGIINSGYTLFTSGGASKTKVIESHARFVQEIEAKKEEKLSRTQQLNTYKIQALKELGYTELTTENAAEFIEKLAEIESRKM